MERARVYAFILYPDSEKITVDWKEYLEAQHIATAVSPLHDADLNSDGTLKKAHYHVIFAHSGKKSMEQVLSVLEPLGIDYVEVVQDIRGYTRYLCHMDNPEKAQYPISDILTLSGFDLGVMTAPTSSERAAVRNSILGWCEEYSVVEYCDLVDYALSSALPGWIDYVETHTVFLNGYLRSKRHSSILAECQGSAKPTA